MLWLLPLAAIDTSPAGCDAIMSKMTYTRSSTRHLPCRSVGIGSLINNDLVPALIADQAFPQFHCHALGLHSCAPREVFPHGPIGVRRRAGGRLKIAGGIIKRCGTRVLYTAAALALNFSRRVERNTTAVHIRNGDKMNFESRKLRGVTDNSTWWRGFLKGKVVGRLKVYSDSCDIAKEVARPWGGSVSCPTRPVHTGKGRALMTCAETMAWLDEIRAMANAEVFVGSMRSNIPRLVRRLRKGDGVPVPQSATGRMWWD